MQPRSESLYNPSQSRWFRTKPKQSNSYVCSLFHYIYFTWLPRFPILWITRQVNTAKHSTVLIIPDTENRAVPIFMNYYITITSGISWDKTVTATTEEIREWGQIKLSSESSSRYNSRDKMTNLRLKAYRRKQIRYFLNSKHIGNNFWGRHSHSTFIWHMSHAVSVSVRVPGQASEVNIESEDSVEKINRLRIQQEWSSGKMI